MFLSIVFVTNKIFKRKYNFLTPKKLSVIRRFDLIIKDRHWNWSYQSITLFIYLHIYLLIHIFICLHIYLSNVWSIKIRTIQKLSLWLYYDFFWQILISYCKFLMPRPLKWSILGAHTITQWKIPPN